MLLRSNKGFTLVELLVVMAIMGVLAAALTTQISKARAMGQAIRCKANLKNLAQAATSYSVDDGENRLPWAGSHEVAWMDDAGGGAYKMLYHLRPGWVGWLGGGPWKSQGPVPGKDPSFYGDKDQVYQSLTNGTLWSLVGRDLKAYVCETHKMVGRRHGMTVMRSYVMNSYFGYDDRIGTAGASLDREVHLSSLSTRGNVGGLLMFAELPAFTPSGQGWGDVGTAKDAKAGDGVLQMKIVGYNERARFTEEHIGFNHKVGKQYAAHVAFADGHVDVVVAPSSPTLKSLQALTFFLCNGADVPADSSTWEGERAKYK